MSIGDKIRSGTEGLCRTHLCTPGHVQADSGRVKAQSDGEIDQSPLPAWSLRGPLTGQVIEFL